jgi:hypothetical protein
MLSSVWRGSVRRSTSTLQIVGAGGGSARELALIGVIDEDTDLGFLGTLSGHVRLDMRGIRRINSYGVRAWTEAMRRLPPDVTIELVACPPPIVDQVNLVRGFLGRATILSFEMTFECDRCGRDLERIVEVREVRDHDGRFPPATCPGCGSAMVPAELEELYLRFLREPG